MSAVPPPPVLPGAQPTVHDLARQAAANLATLSNAHPFTVTRAAKTAHSLLPVPLRT
jgi:hypothetical protein